MLSFRELLSFDKKDKIVLYRGKDNGADFIAYIRCQKDGYVRVMRESGAGIEADISSYGEVIYHDNVAEPDAKAKQFLANYLAVNQ